MTSMNKALAIGALLLLILGVTGTVLFHHGKAQPEYSLLQAAAAIRANNMDLVGRYVDVESISANAIDAVQEVALEVMRGPMESGTVWETLIAGYIEEVRPRVREYARQDVLNYLNALGARLNISNQLRLSPYTSIFKGFHRSDHDRAYIVVNHSEWGDRFPEGIELQMKNQGGYWRVIEISNLKSALIAQAERYERHVISTSETVELTFTSLGETGQWLSKDWRRSPEYSVLHMALAVTDRDFEKFERYFDFSSVVGVALDLMIEEAKQKRQKATDPWEALAEGLATLLVVSKKQEIIDIARMAAKTAIEGEPLDSGDSPSTQTSGPAFAAQRLFSNPDGAIQELSLSRVGKVAFLEISLKANDPEETFELKMLQRDDDWQVVELMDMRDIIKEGGIFEQ